MDPETDEEISDSEVENKQEKENSPKVQFVFDQNEDLFTSSENIVNPFAKYAKQTRNTSCQTSFNSKECDDRTIEQDLKYLDQCKNEALKFVETKKYLLKNVNVQRSFRNETIKAIHQRYDITRNAALSSVLELSNIRKCANALVFFPQQVYKNVVESEKERSYHQKNHNSMCSLLRDYSYMFSFFVGGVVMGFNLSGYYF